MTFKRLNYTRTIIIAWLCAFLLTTILPTTTLYAQSEPATSSNETLGGLQLQSNNGTLQLQWQSGVQAASFDAQSLTSYGGYLLPLQTLTVELPAEQEAVGAMAAIAITSLNSTPYAGELLPAPVYSPPALDYVPEPINTPYIEPQLPTAPIFVMAEGVQRGKYLVVLGFTPIYQDPNSGQILYAEGMDAAVAGASLSAEDDAISQATAAPDNAALFAPVATLATAPAPTNPLANTNAYKLMVSNVGIQQITGAELAAAGLTNPQANRVRIFYRGVELPLHVIDNNNNNVINNDDVVRFYAAEAGDTWNITSVYWLAVSGSVEGKRMSTRQVAAAGATARNIAYEVGRYQKNIVYESTLAGADNDNWFQANLRAETANASFVVTFTPQLPLNNSLPTRLSLNITPYTIGPYGTVPHRLQFSTSGYNSTTNLEVQFTGQRPFANVSLPISLDKAANSWTISLQKETTKRAIMIDAIDYLLPVQLNFGGKGATIQGVDDTWRYQFSNTPTNVAGGRALYDITDPTAISRLNIPGGANFEIQDGPTARRYILTGTGTLFTPTIQAHKAVNLGGSGAAHAIYIAPANLHASLQPLVDLRKSQGYQVRVIDVQAIYDSWSYGMIDAEAIRSFLRFAVGKWSPAPISAVLVGDTTWDPHNYWGYDNPSLIPPYIANVDPWLKYVPCDSCYGQLDGDDPSKDYLVDIWIGRFPVINEVELNAVVNKIVRYETDTNKTDLWRGVSLQIADDDVRPDNTIDTAGPFVGSAEHIITLMPKSIRHLRNYYMAATDFSNVPNSLMNVLSTVSKWFEADPNVALQRSVSMMNSGVGLVTYTGHANHWQWARTLVEGNNWLFGLWEVRQLNNNNSPFIAMSMTCYTSQFHKPETNHFTLDEHLFLHGNGGAIATWGPTGFSIVPAHDVMQIGFHELLWKSPPQQAKLGALTKAGYQKVFSSGQNLDVNKTFVLMGDPLTPARIMPTNAIYMPLTARK